MLYLMRFTGEGLALGSYHSLASPDLDAVVRVVIHEVGEDDFGHKQCRLAVSVPPPPLVIVRKEMRTPGKPMGTVADVDAQRQMPAAPPVMPQFFWRRNGQSLLVGDDVELLIVEIRATGVRIGIGAPTSVKIRKLDAAPAAPSLCAAVGPKVHSGEVQSAK